MGLRTDFKDQERKLKEKFKNILDQKDSEIARINRDLQVGQAQLKQTKTQMIDLQQKLQLALTNPQSQLQMAEENINFRKFTNTQENSGISSVQPHPNYSPNSNNSTNSGKKLHAQQKALGIGKGKSPYLNDCF